MQWPLNLHVEPTEITMKKYFVDNTCKIDLLYCIIISVGCILSDLRSNVSLNTEAARSSGLADGQTFSIENFTYSNVVVAETMFKHFQETNFRGITVSCLSWRNMIVYSSGSPVKGYAWVKDIYDIMDTYYGLDWHKYMNLDTCYATRNDCYFPLVSTKEEFHWNAIPLEWEITVAQQSVSIGTWRLVY